MKKRTPISLLLLIAAIVLLGSVCVSADTTEPQIISFDTEQYSLAAIEAVAEEYGLTYILDGFYSCSETAAAALADHPMVLSAEPAGVAVLCDASPSAFYNDPYAGEQWALDAINIEPCWKSYTRGSKDIVVCVIDSGFYFNHSDAQQNYIMGNDYVSDKEVNVLIDDTSHGTSVAGVIGATSGNGIGITGLLKDVTVVIQKAFYWDSFQQLKIATADDIAAAIRDAVDVYHANVINMSFLFDEDHPVIREACEYAVSQGAILVAAAGNNGSQGSALQYPAAYDCVVGVGAVDSTKTVANFSAKNSSVFCTAPGVNIYTLRNPYSKENPILNDYRHDAGGTSLATPHVAGLAALAKAYDPELDAVAFQKLLKESCTDLGAPGYDFSYGYGLINCEKMMRLIDGNVFDDVVKGDWFHDAVVDVYQNKLMVGMSDNLFEPATSLTRGMFITILHRMDGEPASAAEIPFTDVPADQYYRKAVAWAYENKISMGVSATDFAPDSPITREEVVTMLYRYYTTYKQQTLADNGASVAFRDAGDIASWSSEAVAAMVKAGIITGYENLDENGIYYTFQPKRVTTRAEAAKMISGLE